MGLGALRRASALGCQFCCIGDQKIQFIGPELLDEFTQPAHAPWVELVEPVPPFFAGSHQSGLLQEQQVLGYSRTAHRKVRGQLPYSLFPARQEVQQPAPIRLCGYLQSIQHKKYVSGR